MTTVAENRTRDRSRRRAVGRGPSRPLREMVCDISDLCRACPHVNRTYAEALQNKHNASLRSILTTLKSEIEAGPIPALGPHASVRTVGYRCVAKLAVRQSRLRGRRFDLGLYQPGSHRVVDIRGCPLHVTTIRRGLACLGKVLEESSLTPYNERDGSGDLRYIIMRAAHQTDEVMITFVLTSPNRLALRRIVTQMRQRDVQVAVAAMNIQPASGNAILGPKTTVIAGQEKLRESLCGLRIELGPTSFFQTNPWQAERIYQRVKDIVGPSITEGSVGWDLYTGTGIIAMLLASQGYRTLAIEENPEAVRDAGTNARRNDLDGDIEFRDGRVEDTLDRIPSWAHSPNVVVANPSRRGMAKEVREALKSLRQRTPSRLIYVSCHGESLARDLQDLVAGGWQLHQLESFDMFPHTDHLEWLAVLS